METEPGQVSIRLLGPMSVHLNHRPVTPTAGKQRQVLALLALNPGQMVATATITEELWGDTPPRSCATTLQTYILQLRNKIAAAPGRQVLRTTHCGYLLEENTCQTDISQYGQLVTSGRAAAENGDHRAASAQLQHALSLWRGPALADIPQGRILELEATCLEQARLGMLERRIEADLALGRQSDLIGELTLLTAKNTMNENFCALLMTALYRSGHPGRALQAYQQLRTTLIKELGVEPSPRLRRLHQAVLTGDPALESGKLITHQPQTPAPTHTTNKRQCCECRVRSAVGSGDGRGAAGS